MPQSFLIAYPREIARLFWSGQVVSPSGDRWNISWCPGVLGAWRGMKTCFRFAKRSFLWGWSRSTHLELVKSIWNAAVELKDVCLDIFRASDPSDGLANIQSLWLSAPFGWIFRVLKNLVWNCALRPVLCILGSILGLVVVTPAFFVTASILGCLGLLLVSNLGAMACVVGGSSILVFGCSLSTTIAMFSWPNRFPRPSDDGSFGLYRMLNG